MKLLTERTGVRDVAQRWDDAYSHHSSNYKLVSGVSIAEASRKLHALDPEKATAADVATIIGNTSWVGSSKCNECKQEVAAAVEVGDEPDYDSATATMCLPCLRKAVALLEQSPSGSVK